MEQNTEERKEEIHPIHEWWISQEKIDDMKGKIREGVIQDRINQKLSEMKEHIQQLPQNTFIPVKEAPFVFSTNPAACLLVEDVNRLKLGLAYTYYSHSTSYEKGDEKKIGKMGNFTWALCSMEKAKHLYETLQWHIDLKKIINTYNYELYSTCLGKPHWNHDGVDLDLAGLTLRGRTTYYKFKDGIECNFGNSSRRLTADLYVSAIPEGVLSLCYILENGFTPHEGKDPNFWPALALLLSQNLVKLKANEENTGYDLEYNEGDISIESLKDLAVGMETGGLLRSYFQVSESDEVEKEVEEKFQKSTIPAAELFADVLERDRLRCDLPVYEMQMLTDPNRGSWDLWETERPNHEGEKRCKGKKSFYARDPRQDISEFGVIGIDFGTKSTVVTCLEDTNQIIPLRIGTGEWDREARETDYENPTVMEFTNIDAFLKVYQERAGKPDTRWADVDVSHTAANNWKSNGDSDDCAAFLGELKQWAGTDGKRLHIRDKADHEKTLPPYTTLQEGDLDPIELYAYYIGLYLNNQHRGKIYMRYLLSFPVTYAKEVRKRILESFQRGLKKSLPLTVVQDEERMKKFRVKKGAGEPVAYAVCALQELQKKGEISVSNEQPLFYGVFDFGGGTSDFDFGIWRKAKKDDKKEKRYNYVIHHFGAGGKQYLGGENLLKKLAYQVFKENAETLREKQIPFVRAPECAPFPGDEMIVNESQEAETNTRHLMEKLRPFWERATEEVPKDFKVDPMSFFNAAGEKEDAVDLTVNENSLEDILEKELKEGIKSFFDLLVQVREKHSSQLVGIDTCHILLAGRSSQSPLFQKLMNEAIKTYEENFESSEKEAGRGIGKGNFFTLHKPLGSKDIEKNPAGKEMEEQVEGTKSTKASCVDFYEPNGKTGVAVGLLQCRKGGKIHVISETDSSSAAEIKFKFYVGEDEDGVFQAILTPESPYEKWQEFEYAMETDNEFLYTTNPSAGLSNGNGMKSIDTDIQRASCIIPEDVVDEDVMIYWRPIGPKALEYVVAESEEKVKKGEYTFGPKKILLGSSN